MLYEKRHGIGAALLLTVLFVIPLAGCSAFSTKSVTQTEERRHVQSLSQELKRQRSLVEELKERNLVLERKLAGSKGGYSSEISESSISDPVPVPFEPSAALERRVVDPTPDLQSLTDLTLASNGQTNGQTSEQQMYAKIAESYHRHNAAETEKNLELFLKTYPDSAFADNALYQTGLLAFENNNLDRAEHFMIRVRREFPNGDKVVSALFAEAMIQKRKQHYPVARRLLDEVWRAFPGSPEANRVVIELKILDLTARKKRES
jgi:TolA-binding protein